MDPMDANARREMRRRRVSNPIPTIGHTREQRRDYAHSAKHTDSNRRYRKMYADTRWQRLRLVVLARDKICRMCDEALATDCDHIIPHRGDWTLLLDPANCQGLCAPCHRHKTRHGY